ncbi:MAG: plasmid recombination protein [Dysgonamonadaceae bacterium]|jgi:hypothetical protein|nr:plasmid recombination protein [Dysgonamonadaceae bacterium]
MGFVVLHLQKGTGNDAPISSHIERTINPANADENRTHLNAEMIEFPEGVKNRTEAIQHRIKNAGITRKISHNQVRAIRVILSGTHEDMKRIQDDGKLNDWCRDSLDWLRKEVGNANIVSAVLHLDEKTPHIHATVVPIVTGERRKVKQEQQTTKKKYKKKNINAPRLCADDIMSREKFKHFQTTYAEAMSKYGLQRGREGSEARHISTQQYYRDLFDKNEKLKEDNEILQEQKAEANQELSRIKSGIKTEKMKSSAVDVVTTTIEGIGSMIGSSKVKRQQQELINRRSQIQNLDSENAGLQAQIHTLTQQMQDQQTQHAATTYKLHQELEKIYALFPKIKELLRIENLCRLLGFPDDLTKAILEMKPVRFKGQIYSPEYKRKFETECSVAEIKPLLSDPNKLQLTIDGMNDTSWFRQRYREFQESIGIKVKQERNRTVKM